MKHNGPNGQNVSRPIASLDTRIQFHVDTTRIKWPVDKSWHLMIT